MQEAQLSYTQSQPYNDFTPQQTNPYMSLTRSTSFLNQPQQSRSQSKYEEGNIQYVRSRSDNGPNIEVIQNHYSKLRQQVRSERSYGESSKYSISVKSTRSISRGISIVDQNEEIEQPIQISSLFAWMILIFSAISNAVVPCWMTVDINCESLTRSAWRVFTTSILLIPFVLYEQRNTKNASEKFINLLTRQNLQKHFIFSINYCVYVMFGTIAGKLTSRAHTFCFLRLKFFFISMGKFLKKEVYYQSQMAGVLLLIMAIMMICWDSYSLPVTNNPLAFYLSYSSLSRFSGDILAILGSLAILYFQTHYQMPKTPRFSNLLIYNMCLTINLIVCGYYFGGNEFTFNGQRGVFGMFTSQNFVSIFYVSIMLGVNLILSNTLVDKIFSQFIRNVSSCFQPLITVAIYHIFSIQILTNGMSSLGLAFWVPGMMLIVGGQSYMKKQEIKIDFLIYKEQEKHFLKFAHHSYLSKLKPQNIQDIQIEQQQESSKEQTKGQFKQKGD